MSPDGFDTRNAEKSLASAILTGAFKNTEDAGSEYHTPSAGSFKGKSCRVVPTTNDEYKEFVRKEKEEKEAAAAAAAAAEAAAAEADSPGHRRKVRGSRDFATDLDLANGSFKPKSKKGANRERTSSRDRTGSHDRSERSPRRESRSPRRESRSPRREGHASHRHGKKDDGKKEDGKVPSTNEEY